MPALAAAQSVMTATREANQIGTLQPMTLVACAADLDLVLWVWVWVWGWVWGEGAPAELRAVEDEGRLR